MKSRGFDVLHNLLGGMPVPVQKTDKSLTHKAALEGGFIPAMNQEEKKLFTHSKLLLYKHAVEYR